MSERVEIAEKRVAWMMIVFTDIETEKVVRRIPYKLSYIPNDQKSTKILVFDTKSFKLKGERRFNGSGKMDPFSFFIVIEVQGYDEGWFDPRKIQVSVEQSSKQLIFEKYLQYNELLQEKQ